MQGTMIDRAWWLAKERGEDPHVALWPLCQQIKQKLGTLTDNTQKLMSVYQFGYKDGVGYHDGAHPQLTDTVLAYNHAQNAIHTVHSRITAQQIALMPLTESGSHVQRKRARQLGKALDGELEESNRTKLDYNVTLDYLVTDHGYGAAYVYTHFGRVRVESVPAEEVYDDPAEVRYGEPRCRYRRWLIDRYVAMEKYGTPPPKGEEDPYYGSWKERARAIEEAPAAPIRPGEVADSHALIEIWVAWHLRSRPASDDLAEDGSDDGYEAVVMQDATLDFRPWKRDRFPIVKCIPRPRPRSTCGMSMMRAIAPAQREHEKVTVGIQKSNNAVGTGIMAEKGAGLSEAEITNGKGTYLEVADGYIGRVKEFNPAAVNPQTYQYRDGIAREMLESYGISRFSASSQVPAGLSQASGKALQVFEDQEDKGLRPFYVARDQFYVDLAWVIVDEVRDLVEHNPKYTAKHKGKSGRVELIPWKEILKDKNDFAITVFPVSLLSKSPAAKFAQLNELLAAQAITIQQFKRLFGLPDLEAENALDTADEDLIDSWIDAILLHGKMRSPESFNDLSLVVARCRKAYNLYSQDEYEIPEDRLKLLRQFIANAEAMDASRKELEAARNMPPAPPGPPMEPMPPDGGVPPGGGEPMPAAPEMAAMDPAMMDPGMAA